MAECAVCGEDLSPEAKSCTVCGTAVLAVPATSPAAEPTNSAVLGTQTPNADAGKKETSPSGQRECPACHERYGPDYLDEYCKCGAALASGSSGGVTSASTGASVDISADGSSATSPLVPKPPAGTLCLVVYSSDRQPMLYYPVDKDVTLIGRSDPVRGDFPDLDLGNVLEAEASRRISRKHALLLRSRETGTYSLRPLAKNTGTQIERELAEELKDYPLSDGTRIVLGGSVRMKFETVH